MFPDAVVIQTHRNPLDVLRSSIKVTEMLEGDLPLRMIAPKAGPGRFGVCLNTWKVSPRFAKLVQNWPGGS